MACISVQFNNVLCNYCIASCLFISIYDLCFGADSSARGQNFLESMNMYKTFVQPICMLLKMAQYKLYNIPALKINASTVSQYKQYSCDSQQDCYITDVQNCSTVKLYRQKDRSAQLYVYFIRK